MSFRLMSKTDFCEDMRGQHAETKTNGPKAHMVESKGYVQGSTHSGLQLVTPYTSNSEYLEVEKAAPKGFILNQVLFHKGRQLKDLCKCHFQNLSIRKQMPCSVLRSWTFGASISFPQDLLLTLLYALSH